MKTGIKHRHSVIDSEYLVDGVRHRIGGPALITSFYNRGYLFRTTFEWFKNGARFREENKPTAIDLFFEDGKIMDVLRVWHLNGLHHRDGGPATLSNDGYQVWYQYDKEHREDGPAIIYPNGHKEYWLYGQEYTQVKNDTQWRIEVQRVKRKQKEDLQI